MQRNNGSEENRKYDGKNSQPTTISVHTQKMANTNLKNKPSKNVVIAKYQDRNERYLPDRFYRMQQHKFCHFHQNVVKFCYILLPVTIPQDHTC